LTIIPIAVVQIIKVPNYNDIPLFLFLLSVYFIVKSLFSEKRISIFYLICSGIIYSILIVSRSTMIIFIFFPVLITIYNIFLKSKKIHCFKKSLFFTTGLVIGLIVIFFTFYKLGILKGYFIGICDFLSRKKINVSDPHSLYNIIIITLKYYYYTLIFVPITLLFLYGISFIKKIKNKFLEILSLSLSIIIIITFIYKYLDVYGYYNYIYYFVFGMNILILLFHIYKSNDKKMNFFILLVLFSQMIINLGSNVMNWTAMYLSTSVTIVLILELSKTDFGYNLKPFIQLTNLKMFIIIVLLIFGMITNFSNIYRDSPNRFELVHSFKTENLKFIFSTKERVNAIDEVIKEIKKHVKPNDEVLFENNIPLLYYLTETKPLTSNSWSLNLLSEDSFKSELKDIFINRPPKIIVIAKGSPRRDNEWPKNVDKIGVHERNINKLNYLYTMVNLFNYRLDWENEGFKLYLKGN